MIWRGIGLHDGRRANVEAADRDVLALQA